MKMKGPLLFLYVVFFLNHQVTYASLFTEVSKTQNTLLHGSTLGTPNVTTLFQCYRKCQDNIHCASINMNNADNTCELKHSTKTGHQHAKFENLQVIYMALRDSLGLSPFNPIQSCKWFKIVDSQVKSGVYWMKFNEPSSAPFQVFCDMTTDGGGWTLVWSYTFTQYSSFQSSSNAITPIPKWPSYWSPTGWVPQSTATPLDESIRSAMDFALWKKIGNEFLVKSNINNWVACVEGTGSIVNWRAGSLSCRIVKAVTSTCTSVVPQEFQVYQNEVPYLATNGLFPPIYLFLDGKLTEYWPTHDPCGSNGKNHLKNVQNPGGAVYLR